MVFLFSSCNCTDNYWKIALKNYIALSYLCKVKRSALQIILSRWKWNFLYLFRLVFTHLFFLLISKPTKFMGLLAVSEKLVFIVNYFFFSDFQLLHCREMPKHTECSYHLTQGMTFHRCGSSLKTTFSAALTDAGERRGVGQVQDVAWSSSLSGDALNSSPEQLLSLCLPMTGVQSVYTVMPMVISIPVQLYWLQS